MAPEHLEGTVFYAVLAWQKERGRPSLMPMTGDPALDALEDVLPLDDLMEELEQHFRSAGAPTA